MKRAGRPASERRWWWPGVTCLALAAWLPGQGLAEAALVGTWDIMVHDGSAKGDHGQIIIRRTADGLVGDLVFVDVSEEPTTATEFCRVWQGTPTIQVYCNVLTVDPPKYAAVYVPDNLVLTLVSPDRMEGQIVSATTGFTTLTRGAAPSS